MHDHVRPKLTLLVAALFLAMAAVAVQDASAASAKAMCMKESCKPEKKSCGSAFSAEFKAAKAACKTAKGEGNAACKATKDTETAACGSDKQCKKQVKKDYKVCKKEVKTDDKACKKAASARNKGGKKACKDGFKLCKTCCKASPGPGSCIGTGILCGDNIATPGIELCDGTDAPACPGMCRGDCTCMACGDSILDPGEQCDPPGGSSQQCGAGAECDASCQCVQTAVCGNGIVETGEACDPPGQLAPPGCQSNQLCGAGCQCEADPCGDGIKAPDEECDPAEDVDRCAEGEVCSTSCVCEVCDCCAMAPKYVESTVFPGSGICGSLSSHRCSNDLNAACGDDGDCDLGTCFIGLNRCVDGSTIGPACTGDADCTGTCEEKQLGKLPMDLECGGLYTGGGNNAVPLPFELPDTNKVLLKVLSCNSTTGELSLGAVTQAEKDIFTCSEGRKCSDVSDNAGDPCVLSEDCPNGSCEDRCLFGAPLPVPNEDTPATSVCAVNVVEKDATGSGTCGGESQLSAALRSVVYLNGDLLQSSKPPNVPGIQSCPLCVKQCLGGSMKSFPCDGDGDCPGSSCDSVTRCLGGPDTGFECEPMTSDLGAAFPTSHDCQNDPLQDITESIGGLPVDFAMTTGALTDKMPQQAVDRPNGARVFCGFCRDVTGVGSLCFEGDPKASCPNTSSPTCQPQGGGSDVSGCKNAVPCDSDADCNDGDEYESCVQRNPGAFGEAAATKISLQGTPAGCLAGGNVRTVTSVGTFCIPPTFNDTVDAAGDLPGPGGVSLQAETRLVP